MVGVLSMQLRCAVKQVFHAPSFAVQLYEELHCLIARVLARGQGDAVAMV